MATDFIASLPAIEMSRYGLNGPNHSAGGVTGRMENGNNTSVRVPFDGLFIFTQKCDAALGEANFGPV